MLPARGKRRGASRDKARRGDAAFTLVELLVVLALIGVLVGLLLPAVQYSRESARRVHCANNLRNQLLALHEFHDPHRHFPTGLQEGPDYEFSWCLQILPYLEQTPLADRYDRTKPWSDPGGNLQVANTVLPVFRCPSAVLEMPGDTDYGGITGSPLTSIKLAGAFNNGVLLRSTAPGAPVRIGQITDGTSHTVAIAESPDRTTVGGRWISGFNCFSQDNGAIGGTDGGEIYSLHGSGAFVGFVDGGTRFLTRHLDQYIVGAICTRDHGEVFDSSAY